MSAGVAHRPVPVDLSDVHYLHGPDSIVQDGVPPGTTTSFVWDDSRVYPGTSRTVQVHVPAAYDPAQAAAVVVFQDGAGFLDPDDELRCGVVLDNLVHQGHLPVTIGVFVDPGELDGGDAPGAPAQRNVEYDAFDDRYVSFLVDEILPAVSARWSITDDHDLRGICGFSSGGNAALTAAWWRPDVFRRVLCFLPSFAQMPGGNPYPALIAESPRQPLHIFVQAAQRDLGWNEPEGNWLAENLRVSAALVEANYDVRLVLGDGGHDPNHAGVLLPDALRWVFSSR